MDIRLGGDRMLAVRERSKLRRGLVRSSSEEVRLSDKVGATGEPLGADASDARDLDKNPAWNRLGLEPTRDAASGTTRDGLESSAASS
jgi:hypothetical protein